MSEPVDFLATFQYKRLQRFDLVRGTLQFGPQPKSPWATAFGF